MTSFRVALVALAAGCAIDSPSESTVEQFLGCPEWMCQSNSPLVDNFGFHDLDASLVSPQPNTAGFTIGKSFDRYGTPIRVRVIEGRLTGRYVSTNAEVPAPALRGAKIDLKLNGTAAYTLLVQTDTEVPLWTDPNKYVPAYLLQWTIKGTTRWTNVCPLPDKEGLPSYYAVLFEGDRISAEKKTVYDQDADWFNIGCAGSTLAKMFLTSHTYASKGFVTSVQQRQAMLKMLSADYCGTGKPFTVAGVPLNWADYPRWMKYADPNSTLEARWTENGAACLNTSIDPSNPPPDAPRVLASQFPAGLAEFPNLIEDIIAECRNVLVDSDGDGVADDPLELEPCASPTDDFLGSHLLSANPP